MSDELVQIGEHGPAFKLRPPHTRASIKLGMERSQREDIPRRCRKGKHSWETIGDVHFPDEFIDPVESMFAILRSSDYAGLVRCNRCGAVTTKMRF